MSTLTTNVVPQTATTTIIADLDETPEVTGVEPNGILVWTNRSPGYPMFQIMFEGASPASPGDVLIGEGSVVVHVCKEGEFTYKILHIPESGPARKSNNRSVHSCSGCGHK